MITLNHTCGFFSCCSVRLSRIIQYVNKHKTLPEVIDCTGQFTYYKRPGDGDITFKFFEHYKNDRPILQDREVPIEDFMFQFSDYKTVDYAGIIPYIKKYFEPTESIKTLSANICKKYMIAPERCIAMYYRGTDKAVETKLDSFENYYKKLQEVIEKAHDQTLQILIQTDSAQFLDYMKAKCKGKNVIIIAENVVSYGNWGVHNENRIKSTNFSDMQLFFATILLLAKCKYIICSSSNCSIWTMFYRGHAEDVYQSANYQWFEPKDTV